MALLAELEAEIPREKKELKEDAKILKEMKEDQTNLSIFKRRYLM